MVYRNVLQYFLHKVKERSLTVCNDLRVHVVFFCLRTERSVTGDWPRRMDRPNCFVPMRSSRKSQHCYQFDLYQHGTESETNAFRISGSIGQRSSSRWNSVYWKQLFEGRVIHSTRPTWPLVKSPVQSFSFCWVFVCWSLYCFLFFVRLLMW